MSDGVDWDGLAQQLAGLSRWQTQQRRDAIAPHEGDDMAKRQTAEPAVAPAELGPVEVCNVGLTGLVPSALNAERRALYSAEDLAGLTESVRTQGVLQPLLVRLRGGGTYEIVAGERRWLAAQAAGLATVPCVVRDMTDDQVAEAQLTENLQRADVHPLLEAIGLQALLDRKLYDVDGLAARIGKRVAYVRQRLSLLQLTPAARKAYVAGRLTLGHALPLARLQAADQETALAEYLLDRRLQEGKTAPTSRSVRDFTHWLDATMHLELARAPFDPKEIGLVPAAGACTTCPKRTGNQPDLFPDVRAKDVCTDRACYRGKQEAHVARALADAGPDAVALTTNYELDREDRQRDPHPLTTKAWRPAGTKRCAHTRPGVVVSGWAGEHKIGDAITVCTRPGRCEVHDARATRGAGGHAAAEARQARQQSLLAAQARTAIVRTVVAKVHSLADVKTLRLVALGMVREMWHDRHKDLVRSHGWAPALKKGERQPEWRDVLGKRITGMDGPALAQLLVEAVLSREGEGRGDSVERALTLATVAKQYRVDVVKVRAAVRKEAATQARAAREKGKGKAARARAAAKAAAVVHKLHGCECCGCTEARACPGGCSWDPRYKALGRSVCTTARCVTTAGQRDARLAKKHKRPYTGPDSVADLRKAGAAA